MVGVVPSLSESEDEYIGVFVCVGCSAGCGRRCRSCPVVVGLTVCGCRVGVAATLGLDWFESGGHQTLEFVTRLTPLRIEQGDLISIPVKKYNCCVL